MNTPTVDKKKSEPNMAERISLKAEEIKKYSNKKNITEEDKEMLNTISDYISFLVNKKTGE